jgi:IMP dehydrogenase
MKKIIPLALTYDDVLIIPRRSTFTSRKEAVTTTKLTKKINLHIPLVSANMDMVTGEAMAVTLARLGGIGIVHRFMTIEDNAAVIRRVKRAQNLIISDPYTIDPTATVREVKQKVEILGVSGLLIANGDRKLRGVISSRDLVFATHDDQLVQEIMTPFEKLVVAEKGVTFTEAKYIMAQKKIEKLPIINKDGEIEGLVTMSDIQHLGQYPHANVDQHGQLIVGGAVGVQGDYLERAQELVKAGVDVIVVDIAHGHSDLMFRAIEKLREVCGSVELIVGNIATATAAEELCAAGVDAIKVGVGPGTTCITRLVTGCGVPQLTAVMECAEVAKKYNTPVIADGGIQKSGDIVKAIGVGADTVMIGGLFAGTTESPGRVMSRGDKKYKVYRGSASFDVSEKRKNLGLEKKDLQDVVPEGVESVVPFKGPLADIVAQLVGGLRSGMSYTNAHSIAELQEVAEFVQITNAGMRESGAHDIG